MTRLFLISLLLFSILQLYAQPNYSVYYKNCNLAEKSILNKNYDSAIWYYNISFSSILNDIPFPQDIFNKAICYAKLGKYKRSISCFKLLTTLGYNPKCLKDKDSEISKQIYSSKAYTLLVRQYELKKIKLLSSIDTSLRNKLFAMKVRDRYFRLLPDGYTKFKDSIITVDKENGIEMAKIFNINNSFPSHSIIGVDTTSFFTQPIYYILLYHHSSGMFGQYYDFSEQIYASTHKNALHPDPASILLEYSNPSKYNFGNNIFVTNILDTISNNNHNSITIDSLLPKCFGILVDLTDSLKNTFDLARKSINLEDFRDYLIKINIMNSQSNNTFNGFSFNKSFGSIYRWSKKKDYDYACEHTKMNAIDNF